MAGQLSKRHSFQDQLIESSPMATFPAITSRQNGVKCRVCQPEKVSCHEAGHHRVLPAMHEGHDKHTLVPTKVMTRITHFIRYSFSADSGFWKAKKRFSNSGDR